LNILHRIRFKNEKCINLDFIPSYVKYSNTLLKVVKVINLSSEGKIFAADASCMYTNIDVNTGLHTFQNHFNDYHEKIPPNFPKIFSFKK
jgi:hypothetical protein